jgi:hypothetical protein
MVIPERKKTWPVFTKRNFGCQIHLSINLKHSVSREDTPLDINIHPPGIGDQTVPYHGVSSQISSSGLKKYDWTSKHTCHNSTTHGQYRIKKQSTISSHTNIVLWRQMWFKAFCPSTHIYNRYDATKETEKEEKVGREREGNEGKEGGRKDDDDDTIMHWPTSQITSHIMSYLDLLQSHAAAADGIWENWQQCVCGLLESVEWCLQKLV